MLVLNMREDEAAVMRLPDGREVRILVVRGRARIGFDAPKDIRILRECLLDGEDEGCDR